MKKKTDKAPSPVGGVAAILSGKSRGAKAANIKVADKIRGNAERKNPAILLPDYSDDWFIYENNKETPFEEIEARFYYEFARESQTFLSLAEKLSHCISGELQRSVKRAFYPPPMRALIELHPCCCRLVRALGPDSLSRLHATCWEKLPCEEKTQCKKAFSPREEAFRPASAREVKYFGIDLDAVWDTSQGTLELARKWDRWNNQVLPPKEETSDDVLRWVGSSRLSDFGREETLFHIDWCQGSQAVHDAMEKWFINRKSELSKLACEGRLPGKAGNASYFFRVKDKEGGGNSRRKYIAALRGLAGMRLLGSHTLREAIEIAEHAVGKSPYSGWIDDTKKPAHRRAWNIGIENALAVFHDLFFPDRYCRERKLLGLPEKEDPISYQRFLSRK